MIAKVASFFRTPWARIALLVGIHLLGITIAYKGVFTQKEAYTFYQHADGGKNYFTYASYLQDTTTASVWEYKQMNYPYGEYVFYTDNNPLLAIGVKLFSRHVVDIRAHKFFIYNLFCIFSIIASALVLYAILGKFLHTHWLRMMLAIGLPWLHPQLLRLLLGHFTLSFEWVILLVIWFAIRLYETQQAADRRAFWRNAAGLIAVLFVGSIIHLLYLIMAGGTAMLLFVGYAWQALPNRKAALRWLLLGSAICLTGAIIVVGLVRAIDLHYALRTGNPAFGYDDWRLRPYALFTAYEWTKILKFIITHHKQPPSESWAYLGGFVCYGVCIIALIRRFSAAASLPSLLSATQQTMLRSLIGMAVVMLVIAIGNEFHFITDEYIVTNYFSPLYWLTKISSAFSHFRVTARFSWAMFWGINIAVAVAVERYLLADSRKWVKALAVGLAIVAVADGYDFIRHCRKNGQRNMLVSNEHTSEMRQLLAGISPNSYQAILPLPYFHVGSETEGLVADECTPLFCTQMFQASYLTKLPLMASKMSRTAVPHTRALCSIVLNDTLDEDLLRRLTTKPILVICNPAAFLAEDDAEKPTNTAFIRGSEAFLKRTVSLREIRRTENFVLYQWQPK